jgi:enamine deaminase RidA (YjgF/YER057c/UK114 family)
MGLEHIRPERLVNYGSFTQVVSATGSKTIYISGQVSWDAEGNIVGAGDFPAQAKQAFENLAVALEAAGATIADVAKTNVYIVNYDPSMGRALNDARKAISGGATAPASTLIGVQALAAPEFMIEVEAIAVLD